MRRVAFVTGGGGGIGSAICRALAAEGHRVAVADLVEEHASSIAADIGGLGISLDITDLNSVENAITKTEAELGPVDICVNCAGWSSKRPFLECDEEFIAKILAINLAGHIRVMRLLVGGMMERGWGRVVNVASDAGRVGNRNDAVYSGAKGGLIAFTKALAREVARAGVTANVVSPGPIETPLFYSNMGDAAQARLAKHGKAVPIGRIGQPAEVAVAVAFFASEGASFITGQTVSVSGGLVMS
jgi:2-hydroxycyclohexanecarboxyl-CoA dehydrogenase